MCHACTAVPKEKKCSHAKMTKIKSIHSATAFRLCPATTSFGLLRVYEMLCRSSSTVNDAVINQQARAPVNVFVRSCTCIMYNGTVNATQSCISSFHVQQKPLPGRGKNAVRHIRESLGIPA